MSAIVGAQVGYVIGALGIVSVAVAVVLLGRGSSKSENLLIIAGSSLVALSLWAAELNLGGDFVFNAEQGIVWQGGDFGFWRLTGVVGGAIAICLGVAAKVPRFAALADRYEKLLWGLPRLLAIATAVVVIAAGMARLSNSCPPEDPDGRELASGSLNTACYYGGSEI